MANFLLPFLFPLQTQYCTNSLVNPQEFGSIEAYQKNKISIFELRSAPSFPEVWKEAMAFFGSLNTGESDDLVLVAHNASFDLRMLRQSWARHQIEPLEEVIILDSLPLIKRCQEEAKTGAPSNKLEDLSRHFQCQPSTHRALADVESLFQVLKALLGKTADIVACTLLEEATRRY